MRPNPAYVHDAGAGDADAHDADIDRDDGEVPIDADPDVEPDATPDADRCAPDELLCDDSCVQEVDPENCGACGAVCTSDPACSCSGSPPRCEFPGGRACYDACPAGELRCADDCVAQPDEMHCGACSTHCDSPADCECRENDAGSFECLRPSGEDWVSC